MIHGKKRNRIPINVINTRGDHLDLLGHTISTRRHAVDQSMLSCCNAVSSITRDKLKKKEKEEKGLNKSLFLTGIEIPRTLSKTSYRRR